MNRSIPEITRQLLERVANADEEAFKDLFTSYHNIVYSYGKHFTRSEYRAEELVQIVFANIWTNREKLNEILQFDAWIKTIVRNAGLNQMKQIAKERLVLSIAESGVEQLSLHNPIEAEYVQLRNHWHAAIRELPPQQKLVYELSKIKGEKLKDVAAAMNISIYTVKEYLKTATVAVRAKLEHTMELMLILSMIGCLM